MKNEIRCKTHQTRNTSSRTAGMGSGEKESGGKTVHIRTSTCRAAQIKASGIIDEAISQDARTIIVDVEKARELFFAFGKKKKK